MNGTRADGVLVSCWSLLAAAAEPDADAAAAAALNNKSMKDWAISMQIIEINMFGGGKPSCEEKRHRATFHIPSDTQNTVKPDLLSNNR